jgi:adenylate cyclase
MGPIVHTPYRHTTQIVSQSHQQGGRKRFANGARKLNRHPRLVAPVRRTRELVMGEERTAERLLTALGRPADLAAHELAALGSESRGLLGELGLTSLHAWQRIAESQGRGRGVLDVAVLFTDLVGFSEWALEAGDELAIRLLRDVSEAIEPLILDRDGEVVKRLGDGLMAVFRDAPSAIEAAFDAHERTPSIEVEGYLPQLKTGIHLGRPRRIGDDYLGVDVNIAARLLEAAKPGEILISDRTLQALDSATVTARKRPLSALGVPTNLGAYVVERADLAAVAP